MGICKKIGGKLMKNWKLFLAAMGFAFIPQLLLNICFVLFLVTMHPKFSPLHLIPPSMLILCFFFSLKIYNDSKEVS
jgi:hypothetical protein